MVMWLPRVVLVLAVVACAAKPGVTFHPGDRTFSPKPGAIPAAYTRSNISELPREPMHSVGIIEVRVSRGNNERAIELATEKGRELGCWIVVEHAAFVESGAGRTAAVDLVLVHGAAPHASSVRLPSNVVQFDCVIQGVARTTAQLRERRVRMFGARPRHASAPPSPLEVHLE